VRQELLIPPEHMGSPHGFFIKRDKGLTYGVKHHFQQYFSYILAVSFIGEGNQRSRTKPPTCKEINASLLKKTQIIILIKIRLTI
jgi:hypothetical protein